MKSTIGAIEAARQAVLGLRNQCVDRQIYRKWRDEFGWVVPTDPEHQAAYSQDHFLLESITEQELEALEQAYRNETPEEMAKYDEIIAECQEINATLAKQNKAMREIQRG